MRTMASLTQEEVSNRLLALEGGVSAIGTQVGSVQNEIQRLEGIITQFGNNVDRNDVRVKEEIPNIRTEISTTQTKEG